MSLGSLTFPGKCAQQGDLPVTVPCGEIMFSSVFKVDGLWVNLQLPRKKEK